jgi:hypothetical protein
MTHHVETLADGGEVARIAAVLVADEPRRAGDNGGGLFQRTFEERTLPRCQSYRAAVAGSGSSTAKVVEP